MKKLARTMIITLTAVLILNVGAKNINVINKNNQHKYVLATEYSTSSIDPDDKK